MFIVGIRDREGVLLAVKLALVWLLCALVAETAGFWLSAVALAVLLGATYYAALRFHAMRDTLQFNNLFAKEQAFPSSPRNERLVFVSHLVIAIVLFLSNSLVLLFSHLVSDPKGTAIAAMGLCLFSFSVLGVCMHIVCRIRAS